MKIHFYLTNVGKLRTTRSLPQPQTSPLGMHVWSGGSDKVATNEEGRYPLVGGQENDILAPGKYYYQDTLNYTGGLPTGGQNPLQIIAANSPFAAIQRHTLLLGQ